MGDGKYMVLKFADIAELEEKFIRNPHFAESLNTLANVALTDAVVIRTQDVFAAAGLSAYEHTIRAHCSLIRGLYPYDDIPVPMLEMVKRLEGIADYFYARATEARERQDAGDVKVPD